MSGSSPLLAIERFSQQAARTPDAVALVCGGHRLTYGDLAGRVHRLARLLVERGAGPERFVGVALPRSVDLVVTLLAVAESGAAYVPLDPGYPAERLALIADDTRPDVVVVDGPVPPALSASPVLDLRAVAADLAARSPAPLTDDERAAPLRAGHPAYVIHTSGSTGRPKGVVVPNGAVVALFDHTRRWFAFDDSDVWTLFHSFAFDFSVWELWGALLHGGRLVVVDDETRRSPRELRALLAREGVTVLNQTPTAFYQLMDADREQGTARLALRHVVFGGEALDLGRLADWYSRHPADAPRLVNMYGITETTVHVSYLPLDPAIAASAPGSLIGEAIPGLEVVVLDDRLVPVGPGEVGEIYVRGEQLARGYLGRPGLTAARFVAAPSGARLYRSGDLGRWVRPGLLEHCGRADDQVKVRGFRVELGEVEAELRRHPAVRDAVAAVRAGVGGDQRLVAYLVLDGSTEVLDEVRSELATRVPAHLVPSVLRAIDAVPLTAHGKLDRAALPDPGRPVAAAGRSPRTELERLLCGAFAAALGIERVGIDDDFVALGGHSLLAVQACNRIRVGAGVEVSVADLTRAGTVAALAPVVAAATRPVLDPASIPDDGPAPLSYAQRRMWVHAVTSPDDPGYAVVLAWRLRGRLDRAALGAAVLDLITRHDALRTVVADRDGDLVQRVLGPDETGALVRWRDGPGSADAVAAAVRDGFAVDREPPLRVEVFAGAPDDHVVALVVHHIAVDEWSVPTLVDDLSAGYAARVAGAAPEFPALPASYAGYARWERQRLGDPRDPGSRVAAQVGFWARELAGLPVELPLRTDRPRPDVGGTAAAEVSVRLDDTDHGLLRGLAEQAGTTLFVPFAAAVAVVLHRCGAGVDVPLGVPVADRGHPAFDHVVGFFANTVVLRTDLSGEPSFAELTGRLHGRYLAAIDHQDAPFDRVVDALAPDRSLTRHPLFQTAVALDDARRGRERPRLPGLEVELLPVGDQAARFDLEWHLRPDPDGRDSTVRLVYAAALFDEPTAEAMRDQLMRVLREAAADPRRPLTATATASPRGETVVGRVADHLAAVLDTDVAPDGDFFALGGDSIIAIQLANRLRADGLELSPQDVFRARTPRRLAERVVAARARGTGPADAASPGLPEHGPLPLLPIVHRLREWGGPIGRFAQSTLLVAPADLSEDGLVTVVDHLVERHAGLRQRLHRTTTGLWAIEVRPGGDPRAVAEVRRVAVDPDPGGFDAALVAESSAAADRLDPETGAMVQVVWFDAGPSRDGRLLLLAHHLVVDGVSWHVLVADLAQGWEQCRAGRAVELDPVGTSLRHAAHLIGGLAHDPARLAGTGRWAEVLAPGAELVAGAGPGTVADTAVHTVTLPPDEATPLLTSVPAAARSAVTDVLLAGLHLALGRWIGTPRPLLVDLERHGRDLPGPEASDVDLARTVGWFTSIAPVRLPAVGDAATALRAVKEELAAQPDGGLGFGVLRHLHPQAAAQLAPLAGPQVLFNYLGRYGAETGHGQWPAAPEEVRVAPDPELGVPYPLAVDVFRRETPDGPTLHARLTRLTGALTGDDAERIAELWRAALAEIRSAAAAGAIGLSPSDLPLVELDQRAIDSVVAVAAPARVEDIWPMSPLQEGLYFESELRGDGDTYTAQLTLDLDHRLDAERLRAAFAALLHRHPTLRAGFTSAGSAGPVQFVVTAPLADVTVVDLTATPAGTQLDRALVKVLDDDRNRPFDTAAPPLCRLTLVHLAGDRDRLVINRQVLLWDGWSVQQVSEELLALYDSAGDPSSLPAPQAGFPDYLRWLRGRDVDASVQAWSDALAGVDEPTLLFAAPPGSALSRPTARNDELSAELTAGLRALAAELGVTLNAVLNAALAVVLGRYTGRSDVVFGSTVSGRPTEVAGLDRVVGLFLNTVPVRATLAPGERFADLVGQVHERRTSLMEHEFVGLGQIQRATGHRQLFDVLYVLQNFEDFAATDRLYRRHGVVGEQSEDHTHYPLTLVVAPDRALRLRLEYRADVVGDQVAGEFLARFVSVLRQAAANRALAAVELLLPGEERRIATATAGAPDDTAGRTVADELAATARRCAADTALVCGDERLTYAELDERVNRLARVLLAGGAGPETVVALGLGRCVDMVVALFAVLRTGAAYLPLELDHPTPRLVEMIDDAGVAITVVRTATAARFAELPGELLVVDDEAGARRLREAAPHDISDDELGAFARSNPDRLEFAAYLIYTSGSTGRPKGVVTPYRGLTNMLDNHHEEIFAPTIAGTGGRRLRIAHTVSFAFDMSWEELLWLTAGHEVHVCDEDLRRDAIGLVDYCDTHRIDVVNVTPTYARVLIEEGLLDDAGHRPPLVMLGGEAIPDSVWAALRDTPGTVGYNLYGPTEYTINALGAGTLASATPTIGRPIRGTRAVVLDDWLRQVPDEVVGELYLAGVGLARGYHARPVSTAERFVADPGVPGGRMYRTGDLVRRRRDGTLDYLGRSDSQVKVRGHRVEPTEITAVLDARADVTASAVVAVRADAGGEADLRLVGYVVPAPRDDAARAATERAQVEEWRGVYDEEYAQIPTALLGEDYAGWTSSYDGTPIPFDQMHRWRGDILDRIARLGATRVLEIGVGSGLLLSGLANTPGCVEYWGTDLSATVIDRLRTDLAQVDLPAEVTLRAQPADDLTGLPTGRFDVVVVNSVIQYFPSVEHLTDVVRGALTLLAPGGALVVGDVRHHGLLTHFHTGTQRARAGVDADAEVVDRAVRRAVALEKELLVDPDHFARLPDLLPAVTGVDLRIKDSDDPNELSRYRYDVVLHTRPAPELQRVPPTGLRWGIDLVDPAELAGHLDGPAPVRVTGVPNPRLASTSDVGSLLAVVAAAGREPVLTWSADDPTRLDVVIVTGDRPLAGSYGGPLGTGRPEANEPALARDRAALAAEITADLRARLPGHLVPSAIVPVPALPLTANGKLDLDALPAPEPVPHAGGRAPATATERLVCAVFADVLGLPSVGADDNFFLLGGHSLLATRLVSRLRGELAEREPGAGVDLRISDVMAGQTPEAVAAVIRAGATTGRDRAHAPVLRIGPPGIDRPALFCVHPLFGLSWVYAGLARHLGGRPIFGLQSPLLSGGRADRTIAETAGRYATQIRKLQPDGPYHLLGWSFGGPVVHAVACLLERQGARVGAVVVVDAVPAHVETWRAAGDDRDREYAEWYLGPVPGEDDLVSRDGGDGVVELAAGGGGLGESGRATDAAMVDTLVTIARTHSAQLASATAGQTPTYRGDVLFVASTGDEEEPYTADPGAWADFVAGRVEVRRVGFPHHRLMTHAAQEEIGPVVDAALGRADGVGAIAGG